MQRPARLAVALAAVLLIGAGPAGGPLVLQGRGVQVYACQAVGSGFAWHLLGPEATLTDEGAQAAGRHFLGPSWQSADGSVVVGEMVAASPGLPGSIPWLVLRAKSHTGAGRFAAVTYIVRSQTQGGVAPASGCDKTSSGAQVRVAYSATYTFFGGK